MEKVKLKEIFLNKAEGVSKKATVKSFKEANELLVNWAAGSDVSEDGGYYKTDFIVTFEDDNYNYKGTFDLKGEHKYKRNVPLIQNQMIFVIKEWYGLLPVGKHPFPKYYEERRNKVSKLEVEEALDYLNRVDFQGAEIGELDNIYIK